VNRIDIEARCSFLDDRTLLILVIASLVHKLGSDVVINQADIDAVSYARLLEDAVEHRSIRLTVQHREPKQ